jgi:hypothetical protein
LLIDAISETIEASTCSFVTVVVPDAIVYAALKFACVPPLAVTSEAAGTITATKLPVVEPTTYCCVI